MWFSSKQIRTEALKRVIRRSRNWLEVELSEILMGIMDDHELEQIQLCVNDIIPFLTRAGYRATRSQIKQILREMWRISPASNASTYKRIVYLQDGSTHPVSAKGRCYTIRKDDLMDFC
jgi:hypothetical protein